MLIQTVVELCERASQNCTSNKPDICTYCLSLPNSERLPFHFTLFFQKRFEAPFPFHFHVFSCFVFLCSGLFLHQFSAIEIYSCTPLSCSLIKNFWASLITPTQISRISWNGYFEARWEAAGKLAETGREKARRHETSATSKYQFLLLFRGYVSFCLREIRMELICKALRARIAMALYCQKNECVHKMFFQVLVEGQMSIRYWNCAGDIQKILETRP